jgi:hypothetical protein
MCIGTGPVLAISLLAAIAAYGDEAIHRDGTRTTGKLTLTDTGKFAFRTQDRDEPVADLEFVRLVSKPPGATRAPLLHQVHFAHGEVLLAEIGKLDDTHLHVRPTWGEGLAIPRTAIERVTQIPGWRLILFETFDGGLSAWAKAGEPRTEGGRLVLNAAGQAVETKLKTPVAAGRVEITFRSQATKTRTLTAELAFARDGKSAAVHVELVGPGERFAVTSLAKPEHDGRLKRAAGTHRLTAEFDGDRLHLFVDEVVLWTQSTGPGELNGIRLVADGTGEESASVDDVAVSRAERPVEPRPWADFTADAVRSPDGDETFGSLTAAGSRGLAFEVKGRKFSLAWPEVAEFTFRRGAIPERSTAGEHVRVRVRSADGARDVLDGAAKSFDDKTLGLAHAFLGDLTIPRDRLEEVRLRFHGRRLPADSTPHHLGTRPAFGFAVPKPAGLYLTMSAKIDPAPTAGFVVIDAAQVSAIGTLVEASVNGERVGALNRLADRAEPVVRAYRLPARNWRRGENEIEVRLRPDESGKRVTGVDLRAVRLELHDPR